MRKYRAVSAVILVQLAVSLVLGCASKADPAAASQTAAIQRGNININILASGNLKTAREENMAYYSAGTVKDVLVKIGDQVEPGKVLTRLDTSTLDSALIDAQISVDKARLDLGNAVSGNDGKAPDPINIASMEQALKSAEAKLATQEDLLRKATIVAPFAGLVAEVNVVPGDQVTSTTVAVRLIDPINFQTEVLVNEMEIYQLSKGTLATVQAVALPSYTFPARISLIAETPTISSNVVNYAVTVQLDPVDAAAMQAQASSRPATGNTSGRARNLGTGASAADNRTASRQPPYGRPSDNGTGADNQAAASARRQTAGQVQSFDQPGQGQVSAPVPRDFRLREGLTVTVSIIAEQKNGILIVPNRAITSRGGRYYVQMMLPDGTTSEKMIQAGITDGQNTEVISGLAEGDAVSTATNIAAPAATGNSQQQRTGTPQIPGVRLPTGR